MSGEFSPRLTLPFLQPGQAQKDMSHNEALQALDMWVQPVVETADLAVPPATPVEGQCWIVAAAPSGDWSGRAGQIAQWTAGGWRFGLPAEGWRSHVKDRSADMVHDGTEWRDAALRADALYFAGLQVISGRRPAITDPVGGAMIDGEARSAIVAILGAMRVHGLIES